MKTLPGFVLCILTAATVATGSDSTHVSNPPTRGAVVLTLQKAVDLALKSSYRIKGLELDIKQQEAWLDARLAGLKSRVYVNLKVPEYKKSTDYEWDFTTAQSLPVDKNELLANGTVSVRQPMVLLGYPTDGYLSLNYELEQYLQRATSDWDRSYSNALYVRYEQPLFQPNELKNNLESAHLNVEQSKLGYASSRMNIITDIGWDYFKVVDLTLAVRTAQAALMILSTAADSARVLAQTDPDAVSDTMQLSLEISNVREGMLESRRRLTQGIAGMHQRLRMAGGDTLVVDVTLSLDSVSVDPDSAVVIGFALNPQLRNMEIDRRKDVLAFDEERGRNSIDVKLDMSIGLQRTDENFSRIFGQYDNTGAVSASAYIPLVDWGERRSRLLARQTRIDKTDLWISEQRETLRKDILNAVADVNAYRDRFISMQKSVEISESLAKASLAGYAVHKLSMQDLLQIMGRSRETQFRRNDAYLGYRRALLTLSSRTYYDFEKNAAYVDAGLEKVRG